MTDDHKQAVTKALDDVHQLATALAMFRKGVANAPDSSSALYLHRAAGLMEMVVHDLNSVAAELGQSTEVTWQAVDTGWEAMAGDEAHGQPHGHSHGPHGQGCGCGCNHHQE